LHRRQRGEVLDQLVAARLGLPRMIGGLRRWNFAAVRAFVEAQSVSGKRLAPNGRPGPEDDPFLAALTKEKADNRGDAR
jgi:hypothetical protein